MDYLATVTRSDSLFVHSAYLADTLLFMTHAQSAEPETGQETVKVKGVDREMYYELLITQPEYNCIVGCRIDPYVYQDEMIGFLIASLSHRIVPGDVYCVPHTVESAWVELLRLMSPPE